MAYTPKRPGTVLFVAIVLIILGGLLVLLGTCGGGFVVFMAMQPEPAAKPGMFDIWGQMAEQQQLMAKEIPAYTATQIVSNVVALLFGVGLLIAGVGLLRLSSAARTLALVLTVVILLFYVAQQIYSIIVVVPVTVKLQKLQQERVQVQIKQRQPNAQQPMPDMSGATEAIAMVSFGCFFAVELTIALMIIIILNMQTNKAAFAAAASGVPLEEDKRRSRNDDDDDEADDYKRPGKLPKSPGDTGITGTPD